MVIRPASEKIQAWNVRNANCANFVADSQLLTPSDGVANSPPELAAWLQGRHDAICHCQRQAEATAWNGQSVDDDLHWLRAWCWAYLLSRTGHEGQLFSPTTYAACQAADSDMWRRSQPREPGLSSDDRFLAWTSSDGFLPHARLGSFEKSPGSGAHHTYYTLSSPQCEQMIQDCLHEGVWQRPQPSHGKHFGKQCSQVIDTTNNVVFS